MKDPSAIMHTSFGFWESKVLLTAVEFHLFSVLGASAMIGGELEDKLSLHPRGTRDFLDSPRVHGIPE